MSLIIFLAFVKWKKMKFDTSHRRGGGWGYGKMSPDDTWRKGGGLKSVKKSVTYYLNDL